MAKPDKKQDKIPNQTELVQFRCSPEMKGSLLKLAEKEGTDISKFVRALAIRRVKASERVPSNTTTLTLEENQGMWNKKAIQELLFTLCGIFLFWLFVRLVSRV